MSGGRTPWAMLALLGTAEGMPWGETELFQVDERIAAPGSEDRNLTHLVLGLSLEHQAALRPMPVTQRDLDAGAREYESSLPEALDLVHLGLGPDGHTASLVPGDAVLDVDDRRVALTAGTYQDHRRMTLTYPALAGARRIVWLVTGAEKREALAKLLAGDDSIPAGRVENDEMIVVADEAAARRGLALDSEPVLQLGEVLQPLVVGARPSAPASLRSPPRPARRSRPASARCPASPWSGRTSPCRRRGARGPGSAPSSRRRGPDGSPSSSPRGSRRRRRRGRPGCCPTRGGTAHRAGARPRRCRRHRRPAASGPRGPPRQRSTGTKTFRSMSIVTRGSA